MINTTDPGCDLLVISPHSDDAEIGLGATIALLSQKGRRVWLLDLTRGELATNATPDERWQEAEAAAQVLGVAGRAQLDLPDGFVSEQDSRQLAAVVWALRCLRPHWVVTAPDPVRHPDHVALPGLVNRAVFMSCLATYDPTPVDARFWAQGETFAAPVERWEIGAQLQVCPAGGRPDLIFNVSETWSVKMAALACYPSQFSAASGAVATHINSPEFMARIEQRGRIWGQSARCQWGEALCTRAVPVLTDLDQTWVKP